MFGKHIGGEDSTLPTAVIWVLNLRFTQRRGAALDASLIEGGEFGKKHSIECDSVEDDVAQCEIEPVLSIAQLNQPDLEQWSPSQVQRRNGIQGSDAYSGALALLLGQLPEINDRQGDCDLLLDVLSRFTVYHGKGCPPGFVAPQDLVE